MTKRATQIGILTALIVAAPIVWAVNVKLVQLSALPEQVQRLEHKVDVISNRLGIYATNFVADVQ